MKGYKRLWRALYGCKGLCIVVEVYVQLWRACIAVEGYVELWRAMYSCGGSCIAVEGHV